MVSGRSTACGPSARQLAQVAASSDGSAHEGARDSPADRDLTEELTELLRAEIIREARRYPEADNVFRHGLPTRARSQTMTPAARRALYGAVAEAIETLYAGSLDDHLEALAEYSVAKPHPTCRGRRGVPRAGRRPGRSPAAPGRAGLAGSRINVSGSSEATRPRSTASGENHHPRARRRVRAPFFANVEVYKERS